MDQTIKDKKAVLENRPGSNTGKVRRRRTVYTQSNLDLLLKTFDTNPYPGISMREKLSRLTGIHESRIQVWFQNRRARKNKKNTKEEENRLRDTKWPQSQIPQVGLVAQPDKKRHQVENIKKREDNYKTCTLPLQASNHLYMNSLADPQPFGYMWSTQHQPTNAVASSSFINSFDITQPQLQQQRKPQLFPTSNPSNAVSPLEAHGSQHTSPRAMALEPGHTANQEFSLQDVLEEFQICWSEAANNISDAHDDSPF